METRGYCLCRRTRWIAKGEITWACYCHCDDCRRNTAAPVVAWLGVPTHAFEWVGQTSRCYESSPGVRRHFCETCGTPMGFEADHYPGGMHLYVATMEDPEACPPQFHVNYQSRLSWLKLDDALPTFEGTLLTTPNDPAGYL